MQRNSESDYDFVAACLNGERGDAALDAAQYAVTAAVEYGFTDDDRWVAETLRAHLDG